MPKGYGKGGSLLPLHKRERARIDFIYKEPLSNRPGEENLDSEEYRISRDAHAAMDREEAEAYERTYGRKKPMKESIRRKIEELKHDRSKESPHLKNLDMWIGDPAFAAKETVAHVARNFRRPIEKILPDLKLKRLAKYADEWGEYNKDSEKRLKDSAKRYASYAHAKKHQALEHEDEAREASDKIVQLAKNNNSTRGEWEAAVDRAHEAAFMRDGALRAANMHSANYKAASEAHKRSAMAAKTYQKASDRLADMKAGKKKGYMGYSLREELINEGVEMLLGDIMQRIEEVRKPKRDEAKNLRNSLPNIADDRIQAEIEHKRKVRDIKKKLIGLKQKIPSPVSRIPKIPSPVSQIPKSDPHDLKNSEFLKDLKKPEEIPTMKTFMSHIDNYVKTKDKTHLENAKTHSARMYATAVASIRPHSYHLNTEADNNKEVAKQRRNARIEYKRRNKMLRDVKDIHHPGFFGRLRNAFLNEEIQSISDIEGIVEEYVQ